MTDRNANRPGYKQTKVGWIPEEWECERLKNLGTFKNGISKPADAFGTGFPIINIQQLFEQSEIVESPNDLVESSPSDRKRYNLRQDDILFVRSSVKPEGVGLAAVIEEDLPNTVYSGFIIRFRPKKKWFETKFSRYIFRNPQFRRMLLRKSTVSANTNINQPSLGSLHIQIPPKGEQKKIAEILSTWDRAIEKTQKLIDAKQRLKKGLMQQLLTGRMRFPGFGAPVEKAGELPEGWEIIKIGHVAKVYSGGTPSRSNPSFFEGSIPWIKSGELNQQFILQTEEKISELGLEKSSAKMVKKNTLLLALYGATAGVPSITKIDAAINQAILAIEPKRFVLSKYLYYWLFFFKTTLVRKFTQGGQPNLSGKLVKAFRFNNPSRKEQEKIVSCLSNIDRETTKNRVDAKIIIWGN
jgi:type I restriction enzyme S subunit